MDSFYCGGARLDVHFRDAVDGVCDGVFYWMCAVDGVCDGPTDWMCAVVGVQELAMLACRGDGMLLHNVSTNRFGRRAMVGRVNPLVLIQTFLWYGVSVLG